MAGRRGEWIRGVVTLGILGTIMAGLLISPVGAAFNPTKANIKKIARKEAKKVLNTDGVQLFALRCPTGTREFAGACIEETARAAQNWQNAANTCGAADRRLPTASELMGFRQLPGITLAGSEVSSDLHHDGTNARYVSVDDGGTPLFTIYTVANQFRCAEAASN